MIRDLYLGTAQWGWTTEKRVAFQLLDAFYRDGFRSVDCATNYPINGKPADFRVAEIILAEWLRAHQIEDMKVMMKIGSLTNRRSPECNLGKSFMLMSLEQYQNLYHGNLDCLMVHWDNRSEDDEIEQTMEAFEVFRSNGLQVGLSGIKYPEKYFKLNKSHKFDFYIQLKHNILQSDYEKYKPFHGQARFVAYGLNAGGIKMNAELYKPDSVLIARRGDSNLSNTKLEKLPDVINAANRQINRPAITEFFQIGMLYASAITELERVLIAPSSTIQWARTLEFYRIMQQYDYQDIVKNIS